MRVLIVDDSPILRERVAAMLSETSRDIELVGEAGNAFVAMDAICRLKPDAVILDISMPGKTGIDVLREIKRNDVSPMVMILTNYPHPQYRRRCKELGADFFFDKSTEFCKVARTFKLLAQGSRRDRIGNVCEGCPDAAVSCSMAAR
ncbi:MAG TPA: response regulator transcription factor [Candidatus Methylomirabilis sp.]|nr:response regulator transcription factor [Candidatus Methylomirabilis sp.]